MNSAIFRAGLVGAGNICEYHVRALGRLRQARLVGICDLDFVKAQAAAEKAGCAAYRTLGEMAREGLDVVHVLTPPVAHTAVALEALGLGCHVFVEKPLSVTPEDCDRIGEAAKKAGRVVSVNHSLLRDPMVMKASAIVRSGVIGDVVTCDYFRSSDNPPWTGGPLPPHFRDGGYPFRDLGVHALYLLQEFLGPIRHVHAEYAMRAQADPNMLCDEWRALVQAERGTGHMQISWNVRPLQSVLVIQGTKGMVRADLFSLYVTTRKALPLPKAAERVFNPLQEAFQVGVQIPANVVRFVRKKILPFHGLQMMVADFYRSLEEKRPPPVSVEEARPVVEWTERVARQGDEARQRFFERYAGNLTAPVLVTGASGFLGGHLMRRLLETTSDRFRVFVRREPKREWRDDPRLEFVIGDLGDPAAMERAVAGTRLIYHLGAAMTGSAADFERGTVMATRSLIENIARNENQARLVYVSSVSVLHFAAARHGMKVTEEWPYEPHAERRGAYTQTKLEAERIVLEAVRGRGLQAILLRPGQIFGPGAPLISPAVARRAGKRLIILGSGRFILPLVYVDDVVDALVMAANQGRWDGTIVQLVDGAEVTQEQYAQAYIESIEPGLRVAKIPIPLVNCLALGVEALGTLLKRQVPLSRYRVASALAPMKFDCSKAKAVLGWIPRVGVEEGLRRTLRQ